MTGKSISSGYTHLRLRLRYLFRLYGAVVGAFLFVVVLSVSMLPQVQASSTPVMTLAMILSAHDSYISPDPLMLGGLTLDKEYVAPRIWNGSQFIPVVVNISASAADNDTCHTWYGDVYSPFYTVDAVFGDITGLDGYTDLTPWFGTYATGQFSTVNCGGQTSSRVNKSISFNADDAAPYPGMDDDPVSITKNIYVVLPNAVTTELLSCCYLEGQTDHTGDMWRQEFFFLPDEVSTENPAPSVNFTHYEITVGNWDVLEVDESGGLIESQVEEMVDGESPFWCLSSVLNGSNAMGNIHLMNRWELSLVYGLSLRSEGSIRLKQGFRVTNPNQGLWIYLANEHHFIGPSVNAASPGECHVIKQSYSKTSLQKNWVACSYHNANCPY